MDHLLRSMILNTFVFNIGLYGWFFKFLIYQEPTNVYFYPPLKLIKMSRLLYLLIIPIVLIIITGCDQLIPPSNKKAIPGAEYSLDENGDTIKIGYYKGGDKLLSEVTYKNGKKNGLSLVYYPNGKVQFEIWYTDDVKDGPAVYYYKSGRKFRESPYRNGVIDGIQKKYYETGLLMAEIPYKQGKVVEGLKEYTQAGKLKTKYPHIIFEPEDRVAFEQLFFLKMRLSNNSSNVNFFRRPANDNNYLSYPVHTLKGVGQIKYEVYEGFYRMEKVEIVAHYETHLGNIMVLRKTYNLALENRF